MNKTLLITGGSSGIGMATADYFARKGYVVYELSRKGTDRDGVQHVTADITDENSVNEAIKTVIRIAGRIDLLINNAGYGISGAIEHTDIDNAKRQFEVNFFGMARVIRACLPYLKATQGKIINISSVAGALPIPFQAYYSASKSAINTYTQALANELRPMMVSVSALMPGDIVTDFTNNRVKLTKSDGYNDRIDKSVKSMEKDERNGMKPLFIAKQLYKIANKRHPKALYTAGAKYKFFVMLGRLLPVRFVNYILGKMYA